MHTDVGVWRGTTPVVSTCTLSLFYCLFVYLYSQAHITSILRSKFSSFRNFDTALYTCAPEFDFLDPEVGDLLFFVRWRIFHLWKISLFSPIREKLRTADSSILTCVHFIHLDCILKLQHYIYVFHSGHMAEIVWISLRNYIYTISHFAFALFTFWFRVVENIAIRREESQCLVDRLKPDFVTVSCDLIPSEIREQGQFHSLSSVLLQ